MPNSGVPLFLTDREALPAAVARRLGTQASAIWDDLLLVVPTMETGRRIVDRLVAGQDGGVVFPPRLATPFSLIPFAQGEGVAAPVQAELAWREVLLSAKDCPETFGPESGPADRAGLAPAFVELTRTLAAADHSIGTAAEALVGRDGRWTEWTRLWERYLGALKSAGWRCPADAQRASAASYETPPGIRRIIVAGVPDLPPLAARALMQVGAEIWVHAPGLDQPTDAFDALGRAHAGFWSQREFDFPEDSLRVRESLEELAGEVAERSISSPERPAVICGDSGLADEIESALEAAGGTGFQPEGQPLGRHPVIQLAARLAGWGPESEWDEMEALLRHPDFLAWLANERVNVDFRRWTDFGSLALRPQVRDLRRRFEALGEKDRNRLSVVLPMIEVFEKLATSELEPPARLRGILAAIYHDRNMAVRPGDKEAAKALVQTLDEILDAGSWSPLSGAELAGTLEAIGGTWTSDRAPGAVEIEGWLELAGEDASLILLAGFNEGLLPSRRRIDPLLPDSARAALGLDHAASREARDAAILHSACAVEGRTVVILTARRGSDGSPLKPSRFLLRRPDSDLAERVLFLCREIPVTTAPDICDFRDAPLKIPAATVSATDINVTDFSIYLTCPLRFHLSHRLGFSSSKDVLHRLDHAAFGNWIHAILQAFGNDPSIRDSSDEGAIFAWLSERWDQRFAVYGDDVDLLLQREAGRMRLESFAKTQAATRRDGWQIRHTEWRIADGDQGLEIPGWPLRLRGRIDRIDVRKDELRVIDYKTGTLRSKSEPVRGQHLKKKRADGEFGVVPDFALFEDEHWTNLQLPLYAAALRIARPDDVPETTPSLAYFILAEDPEKCGLFEWTPTAEEAASADRCAKAIAKEVHENAVERWIAEGDYRRFAVDPDYDDFEPIALSSFIEAGALTV